jgi:hypothetical protein
LSEWSEYRAKQAIYFARVNPKEEIAWKGVKCRDLPKVRIVAVSGTGRHLNHWFTYIVYEDEPMMIVSGGFLKPTAINVAAATNAVIRSFAARGWHPREYMQHFQAGMKELLQKILQDEHIEEGGADPLEFFGDKGMLKIVRKILKLKEQRLNAN